ncbi:MAG: transketolase, partial [Ginsengibacter sp.]
MEIKELKALASQIRRDCLRMVYEAQSGHPGGSMGCADFFTALYFKIMDRKDGFDMDGKNEDIFFLSNGHISPVWYST